MICLWFLSSLATFLFVRALKSALHSAERAARAGQTETGKEAGGEGLCVCVCSCMSQCMFMHAGTETRRREGEKEVIGSTRV